MVANSEVRAFAPRQEWSAASDSMRGTSLKIRVGVEVTPADEEGEDAGLREDLDVARQPDASPDGGALQGHLQVVDLRQRKGDRHGAQSARHGPGHVPP